jgi:hypothetical protein
VKAFLCEERVFLLELAACEKHAGRLHWALLTLDGLRPLTPAKIPQLDEVTIAVVEQFSVRFSKLQDATGAKLLLGGTFHLAQLHSLTEVGQVIGDDDLVEQDVGIHAPCPCTRFPVAIRSVPHRLPQLFSHAGAPPRSIAYNPRPAHAKDSTVDTPV